MAIGNYVIDSPVTVVINKIGERENQIHVKLGVFFQTVVSGCSCADDPTPTVENNEYCEMSLEINKATAVANISICT